MHSDTTDLYASIVRAYHRGRQAEVARLLGCMGRRAFSPAMDRPAPYCARVLADALRAGLSAAELRRRLGDLHRDGELTAISDGFLNVARAGRGVYWTGRGSSEMARRMFPEMALLLARGMPQWDAYGNTTLIEVAKPDKSVTFTGQTYDLTGVSPGWVITDVRTSDTFVQNDPESGDNTISNVSLADAFGSAFDPNSYAPPDYSALALVWDVEGRDWVASHAGNVTLEPVPPTVAFEVLNETEWWRVKVDPASIIRITYLTGPPGPQHGHCGH